ncbi:hypothetical protein DICPUDRAFT_158549 [Dictyostelium purpureum]|uniref:Uncharacterized protein n=1 Tax=Dictyostelium purpureum TaxID=5786 RepID=F1A1V9_DICPU|nr:uncharacterized protein DICPUDRAFT_158549 [Dictyostelium purpureum]EGC29817.1 hypothetical protein DICPUDRAFT_158549 [Dictyostelium purpureum]|eukprot:XP_003293653.1 hypothetical protein DICPUDRAFT_158549 [Dictyostelium purpureum]
MKNIYYTKLFFIFLILNSLNFMKNVSGQDKLPIILRCDNYKFSSKSYGSIRIYSKPLNGIINGYICFSEFPSYKTTLFNIYYPTKINITNKEFYTDDDSGTIYLSQKFYNGTISFESAQLIYNNNLIISLMNPTLLKE